MFRADCSHPSRTEPSIRREEGPLMINTFTVDGLVYELLVDTVNDMMLAITGGGNLVYQPETYGTLDPGSNSRGIDKAKRTELFNNQVVNLPGSGIRECFEC